MNSDWFLKLVRSLALVDGGSTHLAVGAMLVMTILYATTMI